MRLRWFRRPQEATPLWRWMGVRISALAIGAVLAIAAGMWTYFQLRELRLLQQLPVPVRAEAQQLLKHPHDNQAALWSLFERYYDIDYVLPGLSNPDWLTLLVMLACALPFLILFGLLVSRPLSRQFSQVAQAARRVAAGDFRARAQVIDSAPQELAGLAVDFNDMTAKLAQYEREVRESSAMLAHELRTPLTAAMGCVQGMMDDVFPRDEAQLQLVHRQLEQINRLVGDLHLLSLARAGQLHLEPEHFDLGSLVRDRLQWVQAGLEKAEFRVQVMVPSLQVLADRDRIGQVVSILIDNVLRYAASGRSLDIAASVAPGTVVLAFSDRGAGVPAEDLPRLRDRFWRADQSRARHSGGSGLGLAIAAAICQAHGGALDFRARPGGGLTALVHLPRA
ncbi:sensor histidine kinase [Paracidovorax konjaci]|uniref:histidine kinase n=2 Tax=Paracidovorax TaxID=3051137 RepID=A0A1I1UKF3_9BURK|nr:ATP-binding protein [Paracidovorax konjaci]SFD71342.1 Signal transduction histidine kinase [Paracidovorax konjaci]